MGMDVSWDILLDGMYCLNDRGAVLKMALNYFFPSFNLFVIHVSCHCFCHSSVTCQIYPFISLMFVNRLFKIGGE